MKGQLEERAIALAQYMVENGAAVRQRAGKFGVSKSTVHTQGMIGNGLSDRYGER